uniref:BZIP domain-containing protein n=1 Tax=Panagrolaimus sp. PS1159 TaxID=55785 RepID=A0AC35G4P7_9BILA
MYENNNFFNPCYHQQPGMTYPHDQDLCDHVPDIEGTAYGREYSYAPDYATNNAQNYNNYYEKSDHGCNNQTFNQCYQTNYEIPQAMLPISTNFDEETTQLALSMKRKREQNKMAAARYREKRKTLSKTTKAEIGLLEERNLELKKTVKDYQNEINVLRKKLNLPLQ